MDKYGPLNESSASAIAQKQTLKDPTEVPDRSAVDASLNLLNETVDRLEHHFGRLAEKLQPILPPAAPVAPVAETTQFGASPVAARIGNATQRVQAVADFLNHLTNMVEV